MKIVIFTDLDGSLLDHDGYSYSDAEETLAVIRSRSIPLIFTTSKTRAEVEYLQKRLDISSPFIVENGGGLFLPPSCDSLPCPFCRHIGSYRFIQFGVSYRKIRSFMEKYCDEFNLTGFGDMSLEEIIHHTGLSETDAERASKREFSEPFLFTGDDLDQLNHLALEDGLTITRGGRFFHLMGKLQDKGKAVRQAISLWKDENIYSIGVGDSQNDFPLLENVDYPILIPHPDGSFENFSGNTHKKAPLPGSKGWNSAVSDVLTALKNKQEDDHGRFSPGRIHHHSSCSP